MDNVSVLANSDIFFNYGKGDIEQETKFDLITGFLQPERSLLYNRQDSVGIEAYENLPNSLVNQLEIRYKVAKWIGYRNEIVLAGTDDTNKDRRVAVSQASIQIVFNDNNIDILIYYILFGKLDTVKTVSVSVPAGGI